MVIHGCFWSLVVVGCHSWSFIVICGHWLSFMVNWGSIEVVGGQVLRVIGVCFKVCCFSVVRNMGWVTTIFKWYIYQ